MDEGGNRERKLDQWAEWLLHGRDRGRTASELRRLQGQLRRLRERILRGARIRSGHRVLDVGAGTGLVALGARHRVGETGVVLALDVSLDALKACRERARLESAGAPLHPLIGEAAQLPFADRSLDAVFTRSVLIYVSDKPQAISEMYRVLRPGGRAAVWEPINNAFSGYELQPAKPDLSPIAADHERVVAHSQERWEHRETMMGFDERDLVRWFVEAGFTTVRLSYEFNYLPIRQTRRQVLASIRNRPNPSLMSYEEAAREVLGKGVEEHLAKYARLLLSQPTRGGGAVALLTARREP